MDPEILEALRRNSGLRLDASGVFRFHQRPVQNPRVQDLFHRGLAVREDGEVTLTVGTQWAYVACDGVARFVARLRVDDEGLLLLLRGHEAELRCERPVVGFGPDGRCYVWPADDAAPALLLRTAHHQLTELLAERDEGGVELPLPGGGVLVQELPVSPGPAHAAPEPAAGSGRG